MKKIAVVALVLIAVLVCSLVSCGGNETKPGTETKADTETKAPEEVKSDGTIKITNEKGKEVTVAINIAKDASVYSIVASDDLGDVAETLSANIKEKIGVEMAISADAEKAIKLVVSSELGADEYTIKSEGDVITLTAGGKDALSNAADAFAKYFVYAKKNTILIPVGTGYEYLVRYFAESITIDGVDISEFSLVKSDKDFTLYPEFDGRPMLYPYEIDEVRSLTNAKEIAEILESEIIGVTLPIVEKMEEGGHYIHLSANSSDVNSYSVKIENGNVYISGSYLSIENAADAFISEVIGYTADTTEYGKAIELTSANNVEGSLGYVAPYTKAELLELMNKAYNDDDMLIVGNHAYGWAYNGKDVQNTIDLFLKDSGKVPGIIELDIGEFGALNKANNGVDTLTPYDLSRIVSQSTKFVSEGGIICVNVHTGNPIQNDPEGVWYRGIIGNDDEFKKLYTDGTDINKKMMIQLDPVLRVLKAFDENNIPVIFRPFHEMQGDWFWWCIQQGNIAKLQGDTWTGLWKYVHDHVAKTIGNDNILWNYSTAGKEIDYCYPGDDYVDIVGVDWYTTGNKEIEAVYPDLMAYGKPVAVTEFGPGGSLQKTDVTGDYYYTYSAMDQLADLKYLISKGCKIAYVCNWAQFQSIVELEETEEMMNDPLLYTQDKLMEYWKNN